MGIALFTFSALFAPLHALFSGFMPRQPAAVCRRPQALRAAARATHATCAAPRAAHSVRPLRVLHIVEPQATASCAGRMVISGRMADVCAELERLAAREASDQAVAPAR